MSEGFKKFISGYALIISLAIIFNIVTTQTGILKPMKVSGSSMVPTFTHGDIILSTSIHGELQHNDIVIVKREHDYIIKRLIGKPGDKITICKDKLLRNGEVVEDCFTALEQEDNSRFFENGEEQREVTLGQEEYFVAGDNRNHSDDSRDIYTGTFFKKQITGKVILVLKHSKR